MSDTLEEASKLFRRIEPAPTMTAYQREQQAVRANHERLKAERLARERGNVIRLWSDQSVPAATFRSARSPASRRSGAVTPLRESSWAAR